MIICHCKSVTDRAIRQAVRDGARSAKQVFEACSAGRTCGGCAPAICEIIETESSQDSASFVSFRELAATG